MGKRFNAGMESSCMSLRNKQPRPCRPGQGHTAVPEQSCAQAWPVFVPGPQARQQGRRTGGIRDLTKVGCLLFEAHCKGVAIPMRPAGVWIPSLVELDTALAVDEQRAARAQVVQHHAFEMIHAYVRSIQARITSKTVARQIFFKSTGAILS